MNRRAFLVTMVPVLVAPLAVEAQQPATVHRIGYLSLATAEVDKGWVAAFRQGLRELGYVEGQTIVIEQRHAAGRPERLSGLAAELVRLKVDVVVVYGGVRAVQAVKQATGTIPIVLAVSADPVGQGLVASLARPGGQVTGFSHRAAPESGQPWSRAPGEGHPCRSAGGGRHGLLRRGPRTYP